MQAGNLIRMISQRYLGPDLAQEQIRLPPPPPSVADGEITLGDMLYQGRPVGKIGLKPKELTRHVGIFATTGAGKTNVAWQILRELMGLGIPFLAIDWKRSYRNLLLLPGFKDLKVYTIGRPVRPLSWNPLRPPPGTDLHTYIQILCEILERSHVSGQGVADVFAEHAAAEFEARDGDPEEKGYPTLRDVRLRVERSRATGRKALWRESCLRILRTFTFGPVMESFNARLPVKLERLLREPVVLELDLALPHNVRTFFAEVVLRWIHLYRLHHGETAGLRHVLILEEAHNVFGNPAWNSQHLPGLENIYREIRSFGQGIVALTQHPALLPIYLLGNTHTLVFLSLNHEADILAARQALFLDRYQDRYLDLLKTGQGIVKVQGRVPATLVRFPHIEVKAGAVTDEVLMQK